MNNSRKLRDNEEFCVEYANTAFIMKCHFQFAFICIEYFLYYQTDKRFVSF